MIFIWIVFVFVACLLFQSLQSDPLGEGSLLSTRSQSQLSLIPYQNGIVDFDSTIEQVHKFKPTTYGNVLLQDMSSFELKIYNYIVFSVSPKKVQPDFNSEWIGPEDGTAAKGPDYPIWSESSSVGAWHSNAEIVADYGIRVVNMCKAFSNELDPLYLDAQLGNHIMSAYLTFFQAIDDWTFKARSYPWGANWYQFTVNGPLDLAYGIFHLYSVGKKFKSQLAQLKEKYCLYVEKIYESPVTALGWSRTGSNILLQGAPYLIAHFWRDDIPQMAIDHGDDFDELIKQCNIVMVLEGEGLRPDYGWIFHEVVRAFGYLASTITSANIINFWYPNNYGDVYNTVSKIMCHPEINANLPGLFARTPQIKRQMGTGDYGVQLQYSDRIVNIKQKTFFMQFFGQQSNYACYEADANNWTCFPLWVTLRDMWVVGDTIRQYNADEKTGNIHYSPGNFMYEKEEILVWKSTQVNTQHWLPTKALSGSLIDDDVVLFFQSYVINSTDNGGIKFCNGLPIVEFEIIDDDCRFAFYCSYDRKSHTDPTLLEPFIHVAEIGVIAKKLEENTWLFTNGKVLQVLTMGAVTTREITFDHGLASDPLTTTPIVETVILLSFDIGVGGPNTKYATGRLAYKVYSTLDSYNKKKTQTSYTHTDTMDLGNIESIHYLKFGNRILLTPNNLSTLRGNLLFYTPQLDKCIIQDISDTLSSRSIFHLTENNRFCNKNLFLIPIFDTKKGFLEEGSPTYRRGRYSYDVQYYSGDYIFQLNCEARNLSSENPGKDGSPGIEEPIDFETYVWNDDAFETASLEDPYGPFGRMTNVPRNFLGALIATPVDFSDPTQLMPAHLVEDPELIAAQKAVDRDTEIPENDWQPFEKTTIKTGNKIQVLESRPSKLQFNYSGMPLSVQPPIIKAQSIIDNTLSVLGRGTSFWYYQPADENVLYKNKISKPYVFVKNPPLDLNNQRPSGKVVALPHILAQLQEN